MAPSFLGGGFLLVLGWGILISTRAGLGQRQLRGGSASGLCGFELVDQVASGLSQGGDDHVNHHVNQRHTF